MHKVPVGGTKTHDLLAQGGPPIGPPLPLVACPAMSELQDLARSAARGRRLDDTQARRLAALAPADPQLVVAAAGAVRDETTGPRITYSRKVFIPLTKLCRDACGYCTFAHPPIEGQRAFLTLRRGARDSQGGRGGRLSRGTVHARRKAGAQVATGARRAHAMGFSSTIDYLAEACRAVLEHTSLLPHTNPGTLTYDEAITLKEVSVSQGMMLETLSERLLKRGLAHFGAPGQEASGAACDARERRESRSPLHDGHPDRNRRDLRPSGSMHCSRSETHTNDTDTSRKSSFRTSGPSPTR